MSKVILSIIVPVYNEAPVLPIFWAELKKYLPPSSEVIFIDDGSEDGSLAILKRLAKSNRGIKIIALSSNLGQQKAIRYGLKFSSGQAAAILDCDLQDPPSLIPAMMEKWQKGSKIVLPKRLGRHDSTMKILSARLFYLCANLLGKKYSTDIGEFYLIDRSVVSTLLSKRCSFLRGEIQKLSNLRTDFLPYQRAGRAGGKSGYTLTKMVKLAANVLFDRYEKTEKLEDVEALIGFDSLPKIAILGGGVSGLALSLKLGRLFPVTLFERNRQLGGLLETVKTEGWPVEKYYHHFFRSDLELLDLICTLGLRRRIIWSESSVSCLSKNVFYPFNSPFDLFALPFLSIVSRIRLGVGGIIIGILPNFAKIETATSKKIVELIMGKQVWDQFWGPLFIGKFGNYADKIGATWLISRIKARMHTRQNGNEQLGYLKGSFHALTDQLERKIKRSGGEIFKNASVNSVERIKERNFKIKNQCFNLLVSTLPPSENKLLFPKLSLEKTKYLSAICLLLFLRKKQSRYYWTNILDQKVSFKGIIEHTNLISKRFYGNQAIIYLSRYLGSDSKDWNLSDQSLKKKYLAELEQILPGVTGDLLQTRIFRASFAQPIIGCEYKRPSNRTKIEGLYKTNMAHVYPADRGINFAVKEADEVATMLFQDWSRR